MDWYLARRLVQCRVGGRVTSFEEDFFVFQAVNATKAGAEALRLSRRAEHSYKNVYGETVRWKLDRVLDVRRLDATELKDGTWLYSRRFPRLSRLAERSRSKIKLRERLNGRQHSNHWYGAMLLFRLEGPPPREEERLVLLRSSGEPQAEQKALRLACRAMGQSPNQRLLGLFQVQELVDESIGSGTEVYWRFYRPSALRNKQRPPREPYLTVAEVAPSVRHRARVTA